MWELSTGAQIEILSKRMALGAIVTANTIAFTSSTITDSANGFGAFKDDDFVIINSTLNKNIVAQVITAAAGSLIFASGTFSTESAGSYFSVMTFAAGSLSEVFKNARLDIYSGTRPANADTDEGAGTLLGTLTKNGAAFVSGSATNGLNFGDMSSTTLKRHTDPSTGAKEVISGTGLADGTATWGRLYANTVVTGASTSAVRMDGNVTTTAGGDIVLQNGRDIVIGSPINITDVNFTVGFSS